MKRLSCRTDVISISRRRNLHAIFPDMVNGFMVTTTSELTDYSIETASLEQRGYKFDAKNSLGLAYAKWYRVFATEAEADAEVDIICE